MNETLPVSRQNNRVHILETALKLFSEKGFEGTGVQDLAESAGVTKPTLYYFFKSKEGILRGVWEHYSLDFIREMEEACVYRPHVSEYEKDVFPQLCKIAETIGKLASEHNYFFHLMVMQNFAPSQSPTVALLSDLQEKPYKLLAQFFLDVGKAHGNVKGKEELLSYTFMSAVYIEIVTSEKIENKEKDFAMVVKQFMHGIFS
jgi:AcrR family transcriptional regulator